MAWKKSRAFFSVTSIDARVYLEPFTIRNTNAFGGVPKEMTDEFGEVAAALLPKLELPAADEPEGVDCKPDSLVVFVAWELTLLRELDGRSGGSLLSGN